MAKQNNKNSKPKVTKAKVILSIVLGLAGGLIIGFHPEIGIVLMLILVGPITFLAEALGMGGNVK